MEEKTKRTILKEGDKLTLPAGLFLYILKELKMKNSFDSVGMNFFEKIIRGIFGNGYISDNWDYTKKFLSANGWITIFSTCVEKEDFYRLIEITDEGLWLIENGVPDDWCKDDIERVVSSVKIKEVLKSGKKD